MEFIRQCQILGLWLVSTKVISIVSNKFEDLQFNTELIETGAATFLQTFNFTSPRKYSIVHSINKVKNNLIWNVYNKKRTRKLFNLIMKVRHKEREERNRNTSRAGGRAGASGIDYDGEFQQNELI